MRVLFDAWTPPRLAATLDRHLAASGGEAVHVGDLPGGPHAPDLARVARADGGLVVTGDARLHHVPALRLAYRRAGLRALALGSGFGALPVERQAALLVERWPEVELVLGSSPAPFLFELPVGRSCALRPLPA